MSAACIFLGSLVLLCLSLLGYEQLVRMVINTDGVFTSELKMRFLKSLVQYKTFVYGLFTENPLECMEGQHCELSLSTFYFAVWVTLTALTTLWSSIEGFLYTRVFVPIWALTYSVTVEERVLTLGVTEVKFDESGPYGVSQIDGNPIRIRLTPAQLVILQSNTTQQKQAPLPTNGQLEMSVPGTRTIVCTEQPGVVRFVSNSHQLGMGFRIGTLLLTSHHVGKLLTNYPNVRVVHKARAVDLPPLKCEFVGLDVIAFKMPAPFWSALGVATLKFKRGLKLNSVKLFAVDELYNPTVSVGRATQVSDVPFLYQHTCNSLPGVSGSPLLSDGAVIAVHKGVDPLGRNVAVALDPFFSLNESDPGKQYAYRLRSYEEFDSEIRDELEEEKRFGRGKQADLRPDVLHRYIYRRADSDDDSDGLVETELAVRDNSYALFQKRKPYEGGVNWNDLEEEDWEGLESSTPQDFLRGGHQTPASPTKEQIHLATSSNLSRRVFLRTLAAKSSPATSTSTTNPSPAETSFGLEEPTPLENSVSPQKRRRRRSTKLENLSQSSTGIASLPEEE